MPNKTYDKVQLRVKFTQASDRANIGNSDTNGENIAISFGKLSKWYEALVPTGGSSGKILAWNTAGTAKWSDPLHPAITKSADTTSTASPTHGGTFTTVDSVTRDANGHVTKINTKTITLPADSNTDTKVTQSETTTTNYRPIVFGATNSTDTSTLAATTTDQTYVSTLLYAQPKDGILYANRMYLKAPGAKGQLNLLTSKYNVMLRNDDSNTYFLVTAQNDPTGTWTSARPLTINNSTGVCNINGNAATATTATNANVTVTDVPSTSTNTADSWYKSYGLLFAQNPNTTQSNTLRKSHNLRFYHSTNGTADTVGIGELIVGNNTASGTAGNMQGRLTLYSSSSSCISMVPTATSSSVILTLPAVTGTIPSFTATPTSGQVVITDGTAGGIKSSSYTIAASVPSGAVFTDTKNTAGSTDTSSKIFLIGATSQAANPQTYSDDQCYVTSGTLQANKVQASVTVCANTAKSNSAGGIALYSTDPEEYGIMFRGTSNSGKHGYVQSDWATYFTMNQGATTRGWIFRKKTDGPVASISGAGNAVFNGSVTVGGNTTNTSGCRMEYNTSTQSLDFVFV